jgi:hypothetical protein
MPLISLREFARRNGVSDVAISKAVRAGRLRRHQALQNALPLDESQGAEIAAIEPQAIEGVEVRIAATAEERAKLRAAGGVEKCGAPHFWTNGEYLKMCSGRSSSTRAYDFEPAVAHY